MSNIEPTSDIAFKKLFGVEENKDLLKSLINSVVSESDQVEDLRILNPYTSPSSPDSKLGILDIKATSTRGTIFNIEMQVANEVAYHNRALYYWGKVYTDQIKPGDEHTVMEKVIGIHILNFNCVPEHKDYHNVFKIFHHKSRSPYSGFDDFELHTIELKKFLPNKAKYDVKLINKLKNTLDVWAAFLADHKLLSKNKVPRNLDSDHFKKALDIMVCMNFSDLELEIYEDRMKIV